MSISCDSDSGESVGSDCTDSEVSEVSSKPSFSRLASVASLTALPKRFSWAWFSLNVFTNNLTTLEDKWIFLGKVILIALLPIATMLVVGTRNVTSSSERMEDITRTLDKLNDQEQLQNLVGHFQEERALIASTLIDPDFGEDTDFKKIYVETDASLEAVYAVNDWNPFRLESVEITTYGDFKYYLWQSRIRIEESRDTEAAVRFYAGSVSHFMEKMTRQGLEMKNAEVGKSLSIAVVNTWAREAMGNIHALACPYFFSGRIAEKERLTILRLRSFKDEILLGAVHQSITFRTWYEELYQENDTLHVEALLDAVAKLDVLDHGNDFLRYWSRNISDYMAVLAKIGGIIHLETRQKLEIYRYWTKTALVILSVIIGLMLMFLPIILFMSYRLVTNLQVFNTEIGGNLKEIKDEKRKTEHILLRMLPPTVAKQLKLKKPVSPEVFDSVSIFFSDVVGFTSISAKSTPMQVVAFLNQLYAFFDSVIDRYDVYKVETIGDAYMVASGVPVRNGERHAHEIAAMALDLRDGITHMQIPHMVLHQLQLRIGLHSGPCVAGVVGNKMPRYCLFGPTVQVASKMESTGVPQKIQITRNIQQKLDKLGGHAYVMEPRDLIVFEGIGAVERYWLIGRRTKYPHVESVQEQKNKRDASAAVDRRRSEEQRFHLTVKRLLQQRDRNENSLFHKIRNATLKLLTQNKVADCSVNQTR